MRAAWIAGLLTVTACASWESVQSGGRKREYLFFAPEAALRSGKALPLVFVFHGGGGDPKQMQRYGDMNRVAEEHGFAIVYPAGVGDHWNDGRGASALEPQVEDVDDVGFVRVLLDELARRHPIDRTRVYAAGISNGAMMSLRLGCEAADLFAAVGAVAASLPAPLEARCRPAEPVSLVLIHGTVDRFVPYDGGAILGDEARGRVAGVQRTLHVWRGALGCTGDPAVDAYDRVSDDETRVRVERWSGCAAGSEVAFYRIDGGGHTWPGARRFDLILGTTSRELDASAVLWEVFARHAKEAR